MEDIKFRYVFKNKNFGDLSFYHLTLREVEKGALLKILQSGMIENGYELIGRDSYTGLKDKNDQEIYAGDILEFVIGDKKEVSEVFFDEGGFSVNAKNNDPDYKPYLGEVCNPKIIDNIYENPELLK